ncbi:MAG: periplasmic heavy metal sensor [Pseudomonadota bacterium]|nr:hypothetical protein [Gammaproteobacteria bacterium]MEC8012260.1 periplasmic heavy metal sensor [Pseudomonadota bacterium]|tara:strand:+ start:1143 stop:1694 length:552 start_codon:yes stop_codon:yes gene_type:complete
MLGYIKKKPVHVLFVASLLVNGFLLGFLVSGPGFKGGHKGPNPAERMSRHAEKLAPDIRAQVLSIIERQDEKINQHKEESHAVFAKVREQLITGDLSPEEVKRLFDEMSHQHEKMGEYIGDMFSEITSVIPDKEQRSAFFKNAMPAGFPGEGMGPPPPPRHGPSGFHQGGPHPDGTRRPPAPE